MAGGNQEDGAYLPAHDSDDSDLQTPNTAAKKKSPLPKSAKRQVSPRPTNPPKTPQPETPKTPKNQKPPKSAKKGTTQSPISLDSRSPKSGTSQPTTPKTPNPPKTPKSPKKGTSKSPISLDSQSPKSPKSGTSQASKNSASKKAEVEKPKDNVTSCIPSLDPLPNDIDPEDKRYWLCNRQDRIWIRKDKNGVDKKQLTAALNYYIRPTDQAGLKLGSTTKPVLLVGMKQIYLDRDEDAKWNEDQLKNCNGMSGVDYEQRCIADGRLPKTPKQAPKKTRAAPKKAKTEGEKPKTDEVKPKSEGKDSVKGGKKPVKPHAEGEPTVGKPSQPRPPQKQQGTNGQRQGRDLRSEHLDERSRRFVEEAIRDTLSTITYHDLNSHPLAYPREPVRAGIVASREDFQKVIPVAFSANSDIYLQFLQDHPGYTQWNPHWRITDGEQQVESYPIRGRGPVWSDNSCAIDACIVAGMLLDAGSTIADRRNCWPSALSRHEDQFLEVVEKNWSIMTREQSIAERNNFWKIVHREERKKIEQGNMTAEAKIIASEAWQIGRILPPVTIWQLCTANFQQFHFQYFSRTGKCTNCHQEGPRTGTVSINSITPDYPKVASITLQETLQRYFSVSKICRECEIGTVIKDKMVVGELPLRLAVFPDRRCAITEHTRNVQFHHHTVDPALWPADAGENESRPDPPSTGTNVEYRWLGGIYYNHAHFRVYWTDNDRQEPDQGHFKVYDGMCAEGAIVGQIPPAHATERIHPDWVNAGTQTILFYEKVLSPTTEVLNVAAETITRAQGGASLVSTAPLDVLRPIDHSSGRKNLSRHIVKGGLFSSISLDNFPAFGQHGTDAGDPVDLISGGSGAPQDSLSKKGPGPPAGPSAPPGPTLPPTGSAPRRPPPEPEVLHQPVTPPGGVRPIAGDVETSSSRGEYFMHGALQPAPKPVDEGLQRALLQDIKMNRNPGPGPAGQDTNAQPTGAQPSTPDVNVTQNPPTTSEPPPPALNTIVMYPAVVIEPSDCVPPPVIHFTADDFDPRIQNHPEPTQDEMFPSRDPSQLQPRQRRTPAPDTCMECGGPLEGTKYLMFEESDGTTLHLHDECFRCRRCGTGLNEGGVGVEINRNEIAIWHGPVAEFDGEALCQFCGEHLDKLEERAKRVAEEGKRKSEGGDEPAPKRVNRSGWAGINEPATEGERLLQEMGDDEPDKVEEQEEEDVDEEWRRKEEERKAKRRERDRKRREEKKKKGGESEKEEEQMKEDQEEEEEEEEKEEEEDDEEENGEGDDNNDDDDDNDNYEPENDPQNSSQDEPQESQEQPQDEPVDEPEDEPMDEPEDEPMDEQMDEPEDESYEPGEHSQDWQDWTQDIRIDEPGVEQDFEPKCLVCGEYIDLDLSLMSASEYSEAVFNGDDLDGQYVVRFDEVSGEKSYIHVTCWICAHCDDGASIFSASVRSGNIRCGVRAHDIQKNKAEAGKGPGLAALGAQWSTEFAEFSAPRARDFETEEEKEEQNSDEKEEAEWMEGELGRQRAEWFTKEKAEKAKKKEEAKSRLPSIDISSEAKEPDMEAALGDEASKLPPPMGLDLPEEVERAFEIPGLDARGYVPYTPDTEGAGGSKGTLKRKMSKDSLFDDDEEDDNSEGGKDRDTAIEDVSEDKEQGPPLVKRQKSETAQQDTTEEDSLFG
jgi:hypothetical protein